MSNEPPNPDTPTSPVNDACGDLYEREIQQRIQLAIGARHNIRIWRQNAGKFFHVQNPCPQCRRRGTWIQGAPTGAADLAGVFDGKCLQVEVKSAIGRQREAQVHWQEMIESQGGIYVLARSPEDVLRALGVK